MSRIPGWLERFSEHSKAPVRPRWDQWFQLLGVALMLAIPFALWWQSKSAGISLKSVPLSRCPAANPVSLLSLGLHPERYLNKRVWIVGRAQRDKLRCLKTPCTKGKKNRTCCSPCQAFLSLQGEGRRIPLRGQLDSRPLLCAGTRCRLRCQPLLPGFLYALSGRVKSQLVTGADGRRRYKVRAFWVEEGCVLRKQSQQRGAFPALKDPLHRPPRKSQL